jgi:cytochrome P450 family 135
MASAIPTSPLAGGPPATGGPQRAAGSEPAVGAAPAERAAPASPARLGLPPSPRIPPLAQTLLWALAPTWVMDRCARTIGEAFTINFWPSGMKLAVFGSPEAVKTVFTAPGDVAPSGARTSPVAPVLGKSSVLTLIGKEHMRQRKLLLPPFHGERMREYEDVIVEATRRDMATWRLGTEMALHEHTRQITLEVIVRAVFGVEAERMGALRAAITDLFERPQLLTLLRAIARRPNGERPGGAIGRSLERLDVLIYEEVARRRASSDVAERGDILSLLLGARDEDGEAMTDEELRDELVTLLLAGHETTATSVAWALERLVRHRDKLARLVAEIDAREQGGEGGGASGGEEYMNAVINETLRVRPVVPIVVRVLTQELEVGGYRLPAGTRVVPSIYLTNRNGRTYADPRAFRPERFLEDGPETFSWIPFGGGIRRCIGASFAQLEMKVILRTVLSELEPRLAGGFMGDRDELIRRRAITLVPMRGARLVWERRERPSRSAG